MGRQQSGFTLIELIAVITILGILAATAVPRFVNLQDEAALAAVKGVAGSIESGSALNHAVDLAVEAGLSTDTVLTIDNCDDGAQFLANGALPTGYVITAGAVADKASVDCTLTGLSGESATFNVIGSN